MNIPLRRFVCVTGVSGSGKSTLVEDVMYKAIARKLHHTKAKPGAHKSIDGMSYIDRIEMVDQAPIGRTPRSIRQRTRARGGRFVSFWRRRPRRDFAGIASGRFSFNTPGGRCENCQGNGEIGIEMHFLPTVYVSCDVCKGTRFDRETLEVQWNGKNVHEILALTVEEARGFFKDIPVVFDRMKALDEVGLGYVTLGQSATTLSGAKRNA